MRKEIIAVLIAASMALGMSACGKGSPSTGISGEIRKEKKKDPNSFTAMDTSINIDKQTVYDKNDIVITANEIKYQNNVAGLSLTFTNNTNKSLEFASADTMTTVNGYTLHGEGSLYTDSIKPGKSATDYLEIDFASMQIFGITEIADIRFDIVWEDENYNDEDTGMLQVRTKLADSYDYKTDTMPDALNNKAIQKMYGIHPEKAVNDKKLYDKDGISIDGFYIIKDNDDEVKTFLEVYNSKDMGIYLKGENVKCDGKSMDDDPWDTTFIAAHSRGLMDIDLLELLDTGDTEGLTSVDSLSFNLEIYDSHENTVGIGKVKIEGLGFNKADYPES